MIHFTFKSLSPLQNSAIAGTHHLRINHPFLYHRNCLIFHLELHLPFLFPETYQGIILYSNYSRHNRLVPIIIMQLSVYMCMYDHLCVLVTMYIHSPCSYYNMEMAIGQDKQ